MIKIEKLKLENVKEIEQISREQFDASGWQIELFEEEIDKVDHFAYVAKLGKKIVGFLFFMRTFGTIGEEFNILNIATKRGFENRGIATKLFAFLKEYAVKNSIKSLWLEVRESNENAKKFYQNFGFQVDYIRKQYYSNGESALVLSFRL